MISKFYAKSISFFSNCIYLKIKKLNSIHFFIFFVLSKKLNIIQKNEWKLGILVFGNL
jgi:hypothetical protein